MAVRTQTVTVRLDCEIQVRLPVEIPDSEIDDNGNLKDGKYKTAAVNAATGWIHQSGEIDVSGDLEIPFHTLTRGDDRKSLADISADVSDSDVTEVRVE